MNYETATKSYPSLIIDYLSKSITIKPNDKANSIKEKIESTPRKRQKMM